jgi:energy-coupling factor transporter ATP-binding protein EcfA2
VVVLDEATASTDRATDAAVQRTVRAELAGATCLVVAHRLQTVADCDRILVLADGAAAEYDSPAALLGLAPPQEPAPPGGGGLFAAMVARGGQLHATAIRELAAQAWETRLAGAA